MARALASFSSATFTPFDPLVVEDVVSRGGILASGAGSLLRGQILMYDTVTSKWKLATSAAVCNGILAEDCDSTAADASCVVYTAGTFMASGVIWPAYPHDQITEALRNYGINLESVEIATGAMVKPAALSTERVRPDDTSIAKDLHPKEIITATGPVPAEPEPGEFVPAGDLEPHAPEMRQPPDRTEPVPDEEDEEASEQKKRPPKHSPPPAPPKHEPPPPAPPKKGGN